MVTRFKAAFHSKSVQNGSRDTDSSINGRDRLARWEAEINVRGKGRGQDQESDRGRALRRGEGREYPPRMSPRAALQAEDE